MLDRQRREWIRRDGYCWGQDGEAWSCASPKYLLVLYGFRPESSCFPVLRAAVLPDARWVACKHLEMAALSRTAQGSENRWGGDREINPAILGSTFPQTHGKMGKIKGCCGLGSLGPDLHFHPRASCSSEPMRGVSSQFCVLYTTFEADPIVVKACNSARRLCLNGCNADSPAIVGYGRSRDSRLLWHLL